MVNLVSPAVLPTPPARSLCATLGSKTIGSVLPATEKVQVWSVTSPSKVIVLAIAKGETRPNKATAIPVRITLRFIFCSIFMVKG
nr:MAG TPA: hypothetical protein [Caudoviricetes sp.]